MIARSMARPPYQNAGRASIAATGTAQRRLVRAPQTTTTTAIGRRNHGGIGIAAHVPLVLPTLLVITPIHSSQARESTARETATIAAVAPRAMASDRHSRRTANHSRPIPGVTLVSRMSDQAAG